MLHHRSLLVLEAAQGLDPSRSDPTVAALPVRRQSRLRPVGLAGAGVLRPVTNQLRLAE